MALLIISNKDYDSSVKYGKLCFRPLFLMMLRGIKGRVDVIRQELGKLFCMISLKRLEWQSIVAGYKV